MRLRALEREANANRALFENFLTRLKETTAQQDLQHADAILIMGSSMAENHPVGFRWVIKAREKGATVLEMSKATGWQPHSCRAFLTGLRKKFTVLKEQRSDGKLAYRLQPAAAEIPE